jgi:sortase A
MTASKWRRRVEITLWIMGVSLLGIAFGDTLFRWNYQSQQERAFERRPALAVAPPARKSVSTPQSQPLPRLVRTVADTTIGPPPTREPPPSAPPKREVKSSQRSASAQHRSPIDPDSVARIEIPRIGVGAFVKEGADDETLARAVGHVPGSARPGELGNMVLAGHRDTFFRPLSRIKLNDRIRVIAPPYTYEYRVQSLRVVEPEETSVLASKGVEELTLVTCYPFRFIGSAPERFIVNAARVN